MVGTTTPTGPSPLRGPGSTGNEDEKPIEIVGTALKAVYMGLDTASVYVNEKEVRDMCKREEKNIGERGRGC